MSAFCFKIRLNGNGMPEEVALASMFVCCIVLADGFHKNTGSFVIHSVYTADILWCEKLGVYLYCS